MLMNVHSCICKGCRMEPDEPKVKSLYKAMRLLDFFTPDTPERSLKELADLSGMLKSSVYNIMQTLVLCGIIERGAAPGLYRLGIKLLEFTNVLMSNNETRKILRPFIEALAEECNETVYYGILSGTEVVYIDSANPPKGMQFARSVVGIKAELYCTGLGKAMLAFLEPELTQTVIASGLKSCTPYTVTNANALLHDLEETRKRGYSIDNMEHEYGIRCVGVPLRNRFDRIVGAISISGPSLRIMDDKLTTFAASLMRTASEVQPLLVQ